MTTRPAALAPRRGIPAIEVAGVLILLAVIAASPDRLLTPAAATSATVAPASASSNAGIQITVPRKPSRPPGTPTGPVGEADGAIPDGTTVFDDSIAGVDNLDRELLRALRRAATDASADGLRFVVESGWRSIDDQQRLFRDAVSRYGSVEEAARWVAPPATSAHVSGNAVDLGPAAATAWLSRNGARYGLCQIYRNEPWHYELRPEASDVGCPRMYADASSEAR